MEFTRVSNLDFEISRVTLGTWAIGGWMWGGTNEEQAVDTVLEALRKGITTIDTAPVYGFGKSEELVGRAVQEFGDRENIQIATKAGLEWDEDENIIRNSTPERILKEIEDSLERLQTNYIDIYQIHWPDLKTNFSETAAVLKELYESGKIRAIGVSNFSPEQMDEFRNTAPIHVCQPPYNLFEREIESDLVPYCKENDISLLTYGALCRGMLSGKMDEDYTFEEGDQRKDQDPKFQGDDFRKYLEAVDKLEEYAALNFDKKVIHLAVRWILDKGIDSAIWGARKPEQVTFNQVFGWEISKEQINEIEEIVEGTVESHSRPEYMAPPE
ncbi:aldo/keto reductase [Gracilimonas sp. Q87]|uniref:aldo/keto reductase n=1 Tax=Gracilimonas sp. Q87 TaxID=3384766 RepID=UPI0039842FDD